MAEHPYKVAKFSGIDPHYRTDLTPEAAAAELARFLKLKDGNTDAEFISAVKNCFIRMRWKDRAQILDILETEQLDLCGALSDDDDIALCVRALANPVAEEKELLSRILQNNSHSAECKAFALEECLLTKTKEQLNTFILSPCGDTSCEDWKAGVLSECQVLFNTHYGSALEGVVRALLEGDQDPFQGGASVIVDGRHWREAYERCSLPLVMPEDRTEAREKRDARSRFIHEMFYNHVNSRAGAGSADADFYLLMQIKMILSHFEVDLKSVNKAGKAEEEELAFSSRLKDGALKDVLQVCLGADN